MADNTNAEPFKWVTALFGLFTGLATLVYVGGGAVYALRLYWRGLSESLSTVASLPRESVIAAGLAWVLLPTILVALVYLAFRFIWGTPPGPMAAFRQRQTLREKVRLILACLLLGCAFSAPFVYYVRRLTANFQYAPKVEWYTFVVFALAEAIVVFLAVHVRARIRDYYQARLNTLAAAAVLATLYALLGIPNYVVFAGAAVSFRPALACAAAGDKPYPKSGLFVGLSSDSLYIAEDRPQVPSGAPLSPPPRLLIIPAASLRELFIGQVLATTGCDPPHAVTLRVTSRRGASLAYETEGKDTIQVNDALTPWIATTRLSVGDFYYLTAQNKGGGTITCSVFQDGTQLRTQISKGRQAICTVSGTVVRGK